MRGPRGDGACALQWDRLSIGNHNTPVQARCTRYDQCQRVEEILRYDPPLHVFERFAYE